MMASINWLRKITPWVVCLKETQTLCGKLLAVVVMALMLVHPLQTMRVSAQTPFVNPVIGDPQRPERSIADPHVLKWNGEYYLYCTGNPITAYHSTDLVNWEFIGPVLSASEKPEAWNQADVWAPEVFYRNGKFYMYYTASKQSDDWRVGEMTRRIGVAVSDSPRGPFVDSGQPVTPGWGIDATVFQDPDTSEEYLFYSYLYEPRLPGAGIVVDRLTAWNSVAGNPSHVTRGSEAWEDKDGDPANGSLRYTNEAPTIVKRHGRYYMMYSGGSWDLPTYALAYATADRVIEGKLDGPGWRKVVPPILRSTRFVEAPGHNSLVKAPNNLDDITLYHARVVPFRGPGDRLAFLDRLYWNYDRMWLPPPSLAEQPPPDRPLFADNFNRMDGALGNGWEVSSGGGWRVAGNEVQQTSATAKTARIVAANIERHLNYIFEANLRSAEPDRLPHAGLIGAAVYYVDPRNHIDVWLDPKQRVLVTGGMLNGAAVAEQRTDLPVGFKVDVYHQLLATKNAERVTIALDGVNMQSRTFDSKLDAPGTIALQTMNAAARFDGVALTPGFEDAFDNPSVTSWMIKSGTWLAEEEALHQVSGGSARHVALKGDLAENYEWSASLRWRDNESVGSRVGIVAAATAEGSELVLGGFDRTIWPLARFTVQYVVGGAVKNSFAVGLPRGFDYDAYHTIRVIKQGSQFTFFLNNQEIAATRIPMGAARPGLFTEGVRAAFDDSWMKRLVVAHNLVLNAGFETEQWADGGGASPHNPWTLAGRARANYCCAHTGLWRIVVSGGDGEAKQVVTGLVPGRYTLRAWAQTTSRAEAEISVSPSGAGPARSATMVETSGGESAWSLRCRKERRPRPSPLPHARR